MSTIIDNEKMFASNTYKSNNNNDDDDNDDKITYSATTMSAQVKKSNEFIKSSMQRMEQQSKDANSMGAKQQRMNMNSDSSSSGGCMCSYMRMCACVYV